MDGPSFLKRLQTGLAAAQSGIFSGKWHKKVAALSGNIPFVSFRPCTALPIVRQNAGLFRRRLVAAFVTIIGWAWVFSAQMRWYCRNIEGTRRAVVFKGTGLQILWRSIVVAVFSSFIIPIPWMYRWLARWLASWTGLVDRNVYAA